MNNQQQQLLYEQPSSNNSSFLSQPQQPQYLNLKLDNTFAVEQQPSYKQQQPYEIMSDSKVDRHCCGVKLISVIEADVKLVVLTKLLDEPNDFFFLGGVLYSLSSWSTGVQFS